MYTDVKYPIYYNHLMAFDIPLNIRNVILPPGNLSPHRLIHFRTPTRANPSISLV